MEASGIHYLDAISIGLYFSLIVGVGLFVSRFTKTTQDFFFGGQRFTWWLVAMSCVATLVGSYSFLQYAQVGYEYGFAAMGPYTNDWFVLPLFLAVWLPIIYYGRVQSIPEYFERRFNRATRIMVLLFLMVYLIGYIGINLLTIGVALNGIFNWDALASSVGFSLPQQVWTMGGFLNWGIIIPATVVAVLSGLYLHAGGQTSVLMTDLLQGFLLLFVGILVFVLGLGSIGGFGPFWDGLPLGHKLPFASFNSPPEFHAVGDFWNDAMIGTFAFYFINQGVLMRFLSVKSVNDGRKAMLFVVIILMPIAAIAVSNAGWIGRVMVDQGLLSEVPSKDIFVHVARAVCAPGIFGLVISAMIAALMSTLDTLITAVSAVIVNDIYRPLVPNKPDEVYLNLAKRVALSCTIFGIVLIPLFDQFDSIYQALSHFTSMVIPPLVVVISLGTLTRSFSARAAVGTLVGGAVAMAISMIWPGVITPFAHGVDPSNSFSYMRALYGVIASGAIAGLLALWDRVSPSQETAKDITGLVVDSLEAAITRFKGGPPNYETGTAASSETLAIETKSGIEFAQLPKKIMEALKIHPGDLIYVCDARSWLGGFRSLHIKAGEPTEQATLILPEEAVNASPLLKDRLVFVEKHL